jgi:hypothetical protein
MIKTICCSETWVLTRTTRRHIPEHVSGSHRHSPANYRFSRRLLSTPLAVYAPCRLRDSTHSRELQRLGLSGCKGSVVSWTAGCRGKLGICWLNMASNTLMFKLWNHGFKPGACMCFRSRSASPVSCSVSEFTTAVQDDNNGEIIICLKHRGTPPSIQNAIFLLMSCVGDADSRPWPERVLVWSSYFAQGEFKETPQI